MGGRVDINNILDLVVHFELERIHRGVEMDLVNRRKRKKLTA